MNGHNLDQAFMSEIQEADSTALQTKPPIDESILAVESHLFTLPQVDLRTQHEVHAGMYARTIFIPAGTMMVGAQHKHDTISVFIGDVTFRTEEGMKRLVGHHILPTAAGMKRVGYVHQDTVWTTMHRTDLTDVEAIEEEMTDEVDKLQTRNLKITHKEQQCLLQQQPQ